LRSRLAIAKHSIESPTFQEAIQAKHLAHETGFKKILKEITT
jgi:hypothetical protein